MRRRDALVLLASAPLLACRKSGAVRVGSKNFSESVLLGEILVQSLQRAGVAVEHKSNLGGSFVCHQAMLAGDLDAYVEYTGTALVAILKEPPQSDPDSVRRAVERAYADKFAMTWLPSLGFDDTFAILVRKADAARLSLSRVSDLAAHPELRPGFGYEFVQRTDGYGAFAKAYGLSFASPPTTMELGLTYRALADGKVDVIAGNSTSGLVDKLDLVQLTDDRRFFPPYEAAPVVRKELLDRRPEVLAAWSALGGKLGTAAMRRLNQSLDVDGTPAATVARTFLDTL